MKKQLLRWMIHLMIVYSFTSLTYRLWPANIPINRIVSFAVVLLVFAVYAFRENLNIPDVIITGIAIFCALASFLFSKDFSQNLTDVSYWISSIFCFRLISDAEMMVHIRQQIKRAKPLIVVFAAVENLVLLASFFAPDAYTTLYGYTYYYGFAFAAHPLCSGVSLMMVLMLSLYEFGSMNGRHLVLFVPGTIAILQSGARTYLAFVAVLWLLLFVYYMRSRALKWMMLPAGIALFTYLFFNSKMAGKLSFVTVGGAQSASFLSKLTSGRAEFWGYEIVAFGELGAIHKLLGKGFDYVYRVNMETYGMAVWAHNDFLNLLLSSGLLGMLIYLWAFALTITILFRMKTRPLIVWMLALYIFFTAFFNGLYPYQNSVYCHMLLCSLVATQNKRPASIAQRAFAGAARLESWEMT